MIRSGPELKSSEAPSRRRNEKAAAQQFLQMELMRNGDMYGNSAGASLIALSISSLARRNKDVALCFTEQKCPYLSPHLAGSLGSGCTIQPQEAQQAPNVRRSVPACLGSLTVSKSDRCLGFIHSRHVDMCNCSASLLIIGNTIQQEGERTI